MSHDIAEPLLPSPKVYQDKHVSWTRYGGVKVTPYGEIITKSGPSATKQAKAWRNYTRAPGNLGSTILLESFRKKAAANMANGNMSPIHKRNLAS